ncbi:Mur ligase [Plenodomus tracheiphilus IPT5]|uniref:Mur ligase n=1 Tax=Plenodomus tracheiphilus IPT5 TaxID=1408161 RepID=A0A6A7B0Q6_9PLEO|nr:Mur ligase [Plenodomus tracheiphilus IPT5]
MAKIQPGLERISQLLKNVQFPWKAIHVAGTNGKGSICHYASSLLKSKTIKCGKFTSPHLIDRWDCISIDNEPVNKKLFGKIEKHYTMLNSKENINASPFEILTATAFHIFNEENVEIGVVEVGMGGKLDATNILQNQVISVISKIARDHETFLGNTLEEIALHKAGILRPNTPYVVNPLNEWNVHDVIEQYAEEIGAGPRLTGHDPDLEPLYSTRGWSNVAPRLQPFQRDNVVLAILAAQEASRSLNLNFRPSQVAMMLKDLKKEPIRGRCEFIYAQPVFGQHMRLGRRILVDGAHNPDAAIVLDEYVHANQRLKPINDQRPPSGKWPVTWVLAMTEGKNARQYLEHLLKPGDNVVTTSFGPVEGMPWVKPMNPKELLTIAESVEPGIFGVHMPEAGPLRALCAAKHLTDGDQPIVLTGSLYLVGDLHRELRPRTGAVYWTDPKHEEDRAMFQEMLEEERIRVKMALSRAGDEDTDPIGPIPVHATEEQKRRMEERQRRNQTQEQIRAVDEELKRLEEEAEQDINPLLSLHLDQTAASHPKTEGQEEQVGDASNTPLSQRYARSLDEIRNKIHALQASARVITTTDQPILKQREQKIASSGTEEEVSNEADKEKASDVPISA